MSEDRDRDLPGSRVPGPAVAHRVVQLLLGDPETFVREQGAQAETNLRFHRAEASALTVPSSTGSPSRNHRRVSHRWQNRNVRVEEAMSIVMSRGVAPQQLVVVMIDASARRGAFRIDHTGTEL